MQACRRSQIKLRGFTLIELLVAVALVSLLASAAFPLAEMSIKRARESELKSNLRQVREAIDAFKQASDEGRIVKRPGASGYPATLDQLVDGVEDQKSPTRQRVYFLRRIPRDPFNHSAPQSWGLRSYASQPDKPQPGDDIFDIYSQSTGVALNGTAYRDW